jgi:hypothetical protein
MLIKYHDYGGGVVSFDNVIDVDQKFLKEYVLWLQEKEEEDIFEEDIFTYLEEDGITSVVNKTNFKFELKDIPKTPERFSIYGRTLTEEQKDFMQACTNGLYRCVVQYCLLYPEVTPSIWWKTSGHIAGYDNGRNIGPHCDDTIQFDFDGMPKNEFPIHNTLSGALYLNDCVENEEELNEDNFTGGHIKFKYMGIDYMPKAGSAVVYPSNYIGTHEVTPVTKGSRYVFLEFFAYGIPKNSDGTSGKGDNLEWLPNIRNDILQIKELNKE